MSFYYCNSSTACNVWLCGLVSLLMADGGERLPTGDSVANLQ